MQFSVVIQGGLMPRPTLHVTFDEIIKYVLSLCEDLRSAYTVACTTRKLIFFYFLLLFVDFYVRTRTKTHRRK
jgi:hypothetical protein